MTEAPPVSDPAPPTEEAGSTYSPPGGGRLDKPLPPPPPACGGAVCSPSRANASLSRGVATPRRIIATPALYGTKKDNNCSHRSRTKPSGDVEVRRVTPHTRRRVRPSQPWAKRALALFCSGHYIQYSAEGRFPSPSSSNKLQQRQPQATAAATAANRSRLQQQAATAASVSNSCSHRSRTKPSGDVEVRRLTPRIKRRVRPLQPWTPSPSNSNKLQQRQPQATAAATTVSRSISSISSNQLQQRQCKLQQQGQQMQPPGPNQAQWRRRGAKADTSHHLRQYKSCPSLVALARPVALGRTAPSLVALVFQWLWVGRPSGAAARLAPLDIAAGQGHDAA